MGSTVNPYVGEIRFIQYVRGVTGACGRGTSLWRWYRTFSIRWNCTGHRVGQILAVGSERGHLSVRPCGLRQYLTSLGLSLRLARMQVLLAVGG